MKKWTQGGLFLLGGLLLLLGLSSALLPDAERMDEQRYALAMRQIAHDYLLCEGDSTSQIPAVETSDNGLLTLKLQRNLNYTYLTEIAEDVVKRYGIRNRYSLSLLDCENGNIFLGSLWQDPISALSEACVGRDQDERCANLTMNFHASNAVGASGNPLYLLLPGILLLLIGGWRTRTNNLPPAATISKATPRRSSSLLLGENVTFDTAAQKLTVGETSYDLTYRESKLFGFLANHANEVLHREAINDAVWGDEGIMVGRSLDVFISRLRKKLSGAQGLEIATVHGVGYQLVVTG